MRREAGAPGGAGALPPCWEREVTQPGRGGEVPAGASSATPPRDSRAVTAPLRAVPPPLSSWSSAPPHAPANLIPLGRFGAPGLVAGWWSTARSAQVCSVGDDDNTVVTCAL
jgi:hypothetical protein